MAGDIRQFMTDVLPRLEAEAVRLNLSAVDMATVLSWYLKERLLPQMEPYLAYKVFGGLLTGGRPDDGAQASPGGGLDPQVLVEAQRRHHEAAQTGGPSLQPPPLSREDCATVGEYRFLMLDEPLILMGRTAPHLSYLTVGDGHYGRDARLLARLGVADIMATDIAEPALRASGEAGLLPRWQAENMEALSFADASWDVVVCREALHHAPRAPVALLEMIRVARQAVVLVEPQDVVVEMGRTVPVDSYLAFEECGNFVYGPSRRELMKVAVSLQLAGVAFKQVCDVYDEQLCNQPLSDDSLQPWLAQVEHFRRQVAEGACVENFLFAILFKSRPDPAVLSALRLDDWSYWPVPRNPYLPG